jgi:hypothetical protein
MARSHEIMDVLDEANKPSSEDKLLFNEKVSFTYLVLQYKLKTDMGNTLVKKHYESGDAQNYGQNLVRIYYLYEEVNKSANSFT